MELTLLTRHMKKLAAWWWGPEPGDRACKRCGRQTKCTRIYWLERDIHTGKYRAEGSVRRGDSEGLFPFCLNCAWDVLP